MALSAPAILRSATIAVGAVAGPLLVRALDAGLAREARPFSPAHAAFGLALAAAVMPGPLLCAFIGPRAEERRRGLAFGGCVVTAFVAVLGGAFLWRAAGAPGADAATVWTGLAWAALALPAAVTDAARVRVGAGTGTGDDPGGRGDPA